MSVLADQYQRVISGDLTVTGGCVFAVRAANAVSELGPLDWLGFGKPGDASR